MIVEKALPMTVRLMFLVVKNNRQVCQDRAVIFASWNHAAHADNQDYKRWHNLLSKISPQG